MSALTTTAELEAKVKAGETISLVDLAEAVKADKERGKAAKTEKKPSIRAQSAVVGGVNRLVRHPPIVPQIHPAGLLHRPAAVVAGGSDTHVGLTVSGVAQVEALALVLARLELSIGVAAGANRLGFQCLQGP